MGDNQHGADSPLLHDELRKIEMQALYSDNSNRVTQRDTLLLGIFILFGAFLSVATQSGTAPRILLFYNIFVFFLMLLWQKNSDKLEAQNKELLQLEKEAGYLGIQTRRAARRSREQILPMRLFRSHAVKLPRFLAERKSKQYWGTVGLALTTDILVLFLVPFRWDLLFIAAILSTGTLPVCLRHKRPVEDM